MKVNVAASVKNIKGEDIAQGGQPVTFRDIFYQALNNLTQGEQPDPAKSAKSYGIMQKIFAADEVNLGVEEAALIKERAGKLFLPEVYGRVCEILDGTGDTESSPSPTTQ